jgi:hypothetical protein
VNFFRGYTGNAIQRIRPKQTKAELGGKYPSVTQFCSIFRGYIGILRSNMCTFFAFTMEKLLISQLHWNAQLNDELEPDSRKSNVLSG